MIKYKVVFNGEEDDEIFDTEEEAVEYGYVLLSDSRVGAEILHLSNPGDYDENAADDDEFEVLEIEVD